MGYLIHDDIHLLVGCPPDGVQFFSERVYFGFIVSGGRGHTVLDPGQSTVQGILLTFIDGEIAVYLEDPLFEIHHPPALGILPELPLSLPLLGLGGPATGEEDEGNQDGNYSGNFQFRKPQLFRT